MSNVVVKPFKTLNRKFKIDDAVTAADIEGPVSLDVWIARGFIKVQAPAKAAKASAA